MAPLPQSNTARWWLVYTVNGSTHRMMVRTTPAVTSAGANNLFDGLLDLLVPTVNSIAPQNLEFSVAGSNVRNAAAWTGSPTYGTGTEVGTDGRPRTWSFVGRSTGGRRTKLFVFGTKGISEGDMRVDLTESTAVAAVVNYLNTAVDVFLSIDGLKPVYKGYANVGYNDHWIKQYRRAGG